MFLDTVSDYVSNARGLLQDNVAPYRYADADLVAALNVATSEALRIRPDLFYGATLPNLTSTSDSTGWIAPAYRTAFLHYLIGHIELRDAEPTEEARASSLIASFTQKLTGSLGGAAPGALA